MLYFIMAEHNHARPVIKYFALKKDMAPVPFTVFTADNTVLCLSGSGRANTAAATAYLLTRWGRSGLFVHIGLSGNAGEGVLYPHTITDGEDIIYQEMLYKLPSFMSEGFLNDYEGTYAFLAASRFLPLKQIIILQAGNHVDEGTLSWLETTYYGTMSFPTYI